MTEAGDGFPVTGGPDLTYNGSGDAFVVKINPAGTGLVYAGYIGGTDIDLGTDIAVDAAGNAYLTGWTRDYSATFPATVGPDLTFNGGEDYGDAFVAKVNATGSGLVYAGYIGGNGDDYGDDIAVDAVGGAYVTGLTSSTEASFPVKVGPLYTYRGAGDAFVAKISPAGSELVYAGYIGGTGRDEGTGIAVDADGSAFVTGRTASDEVSFPVTSGPDLTYNGNGDAFVVKVNPVGSGMNYGGYIGGSALDVAWDIAVDGAGNAFVTGYTDSDQGTFPVKDGPDLTYNGDDDGFVAMVNATGFDLVYAGYIGGWGWEYGTGIAVDGAGDAYIMGHTDSSEFSFPVTVGPGLHMQALQMAFVAKVATPRFTVSGRVTDADGDPIAGVRVGADAGLAGITDAGGYYTIAVVPTGTYVLTPRLSRYFFSPATRTVSVPPDATGQDFTGTMAPQGVWLPLICR